MRAPKVYLCIAALAIALAGVQAQFGCQLTLTNCTSQGICRQDGLCQCFSGYIGENCEIKTGLTEVYGTLGKNFIAGWVFFWIILNLLVPYLIYLMILYCRKHDGQDLKEHFWDCYEAACCCIMPPNKRRQRPLPDRPPARPVTTDPENNLLTPRLDILAAAAANSNMAGRVDSEATSRKGIEVGSVAMEPLRPTTAPDNKDNKREGLFKSTLQKSEMGPMGDLFASKKVNFNSSKIADAERLLKKQEDAMKRLKIPQVTDALSMMKQMYPYDDFEVYNEEKLDQEVKKEEKELNLRNNLKYSDMMDILYR